MKQLRVPIVAGSLVISAIVVGTIAFMLGSKLSSEKGASCSAPRAHYQIEIRNSEIKPKHITAKLCDTLTIVNDDTQHRLMAFGKHDNHQEYDGITERQLTQGQSFTIQLHKSGSYRLHDHLQDNTDAYFTVSN